MDNVIAYYYVIRVHMPVSVLGSITVAVIGLTIPYDNGQGRLKDGNMVAMQVLSAGFVNFDRDDFDIRWRA